MDKNTFKHFCEIALRDSYVSQIDHYQDFSLIINLNNVLSGIPKQLRLSLFADWEIPKIGKWEGVPDLPYVDKSLIGEPHEPHKGYYLHYLSQLGPVKEVFLDVENRLNLVFDETWRIVVSAVSEFTEETWLFDSNGNVEFSDFYISFNSSEQKIYSNGKIGNALK